MTAASRFLVIILVVLGVLALAAGIIYYVEPAKSLPTFFPGHLAHGNGPRGTTERKVPARSDRCGQYRSSGRSTGR